MTDLKTVINEKSFLDQEVLKNAEFFAEDFKDVNNTQARKFFNDIKVLKRMAASEDSDWNFIKIKLHMFLAHLAYAQKRRDVKITSEFRDFFKICIEKVFEEDNPEIFKDFTEFLEAVYAYYYAKYGYRLK